MAITHSFVATGAETPGAEAAGKVVTSKWNADHVVASGTITLAMMADVATGRFFGRTTAGTGVPEALTAAQMKSGLAINYTDLTVADNAIALSKLAAFGAAGFLGASGAGNVAALTAAQATALLDAFVGDSGAGGTKGLVPAPAAGDAAANKFLKANGTWAAAGGGSVAVGDITGLGTGVATALAVNVGSAGAFVTFNGAGGTPSSLTLTNATGLPPAGVVGTAAILGANTYTDTQTIALGSLTADKNALSITATWTNAATYTGAIKVNVTNTSSNAASLLMDLQVGSASVFSVNAASGQIDQSANSSNTPIFRQNSTSSTGTAGLVYYLSGAFKSQVGFVKDGSSIAFYTNGGGLAQYFTSTLACFGSNTYVGWAAGASATSTADTALYRNAAGVVEVNSGTAGTLRDLKLRNIVGQTGYSEMVEMTAPGAGAANTARIYAVDNGAGKTQLMCIFASGAAQQLAIEP